MTRLGPEALLVRSRTPLRSGVAEYAGLDYPRANRRADVAALSLELEYLPAKRSAAQRLVRWGRTRFRRDEAELPLLVAARPKEFGGGKDRAGPALPRATATLAAVPALRAPGRAEGEPNPICSLPAFVKA